jgi:hypothetical protein
LLDLLRNTHYQPTTYASLKKVSRSLKLTAIKRR